MKNRYALLFLVVASAAWSAGDADSSHLLDRVRARIAEKSSRAPGRPRRRHAHFHGKEESHAERERFQRSHYALARGPTNTTGEIEHGFCFG